MKNEITLKKYDVDYSFIIRNYLSPELWKKTWTLFVYKNIRITLNLYYIWIENPIRISFKIRINTPEYSTYTTKDHCIDVSNLTILKNQIDNAILYLINEYERYVISNTETYRNLSNTARREADRLQEIAESYLDENSIYIEDVRDAYIEYYVDKNNTGDSYLSSYKNSMKYKQCTDLWLVYAKATNDEKLEKEIKDRLTTDDYIDVLKDIQEYIDILSDEDSYEYNEYFEEKESNLESIS